MFKLVVLCAFLATATAEPGVALAPLPVTYSTAAVAPNLATTYISPASTVYQPAVTYSSTYGFPHFIKKRSAPLTYSSYVAPTTYVSAAPLANTYNTPYVSAASYVPSVPFAYTAAHLIKKRSAAFPATYVAPTTYAATAPFVASTYSAPVYTTPYVSAAPVYSTHFIKKRSAPIAVSTYAAPYAASYAAPYAAPYFPSYPAVSTVAYTGAIPAPVTFVK